MERVFWVQGSTFWRELALCFVYRAFRTCGLAADEILFSLYLGNAHYEVFHFPPDLRQRAHTQRNFVNLSLFWSGRQIVGILLEIIEFLWAWKGSAGNLAELPNQHIVETAATSLALSTVLLPLGDFFCATLRLFCPRWTHFWLLWAFVSRARARSCAAWQQWGHAELFSAIQQQSISSALEIIGYRYHE